MLTPAEMRAPTTPLHAALIPSSTALLPRGSMVSLSPRVGGAAAGDAGGVGGSPCGTGASGTSGVGAAGTSDGGCMSAQSGSR